MRIGYGSRGHYQQNFQPNMGIQRGQHNSNIYQQSIQKGSMSPNQFSPRSHFTSQFNPINGKQQNSSLDRQQIQGSYNHQQQNYYQQNNFTSNGQNIQNKPYYSNALNKIQNQDTNIDVRQSVTLNNQKLPQPTQPQPTTQQAQINSIPSNLRTSIIDNDNFMQKSTELEQRIKDQIERTQSRIKEQNSQRINNHFQSQQNQQSQVINHLQSPQKMQGSVSPQRKINLVSQIPQYRNQSPQYNMNPMSRSGVLGQSQILQSSLSQIQPKQDTVNLQQSNSNLTASLRIQSPFTKQETQHQSNNSISGYTSQDQYQLRSQSPYQHVKSQSVLTNSSQKQDQMRQSQQISNQNIVEQKNLVQQNQNPDSLQQPQKQVKAQSQNNKYTNQKYIQPQNFQMNLQYSIRTKKGFVVSNPRKQNQDENLVAMNLNNDPDQHLFAVLDGHGENGHQVSQYIKNNFTNFLQNDKNLQTKPSLAMYQTYSSCQNSLEQQKNFNCDLSGTTLVSVLFKQNNLFVANCGDSRAVLISEKPDEWEVVNLSRDHKPEIPSEKQRIEKHGGKVEAFKDQFGHNVGPHRVWIQNKRYPGLAMSRSMGDFVAKSVGVAWQPEILQFELSENDKIILIATDGVWEFLDNEKCLKIISSHYENNDIEGACNALMNASINEWEKNESTMMDDITFIIIFLNQQSS